jgi:hypothetical protein
LEPSKGLLAYQQTQREETLHDIDEAIAYLRTNNLPITKVSIADEIGKHRNALNKEYVRIHLLQYPEFNPNIQVPKVVSLEDYENQLVLLKGNLSKVQRMKEGLVSENRRLTLENKELLDKYQRVLGKYQTDVEKKIIHF